MIWTKPPWGHVPAVHLQGCNSFSSFVFSAGDRRCWRLPWSTAWVLLLHGGQTCGKWWTRGSLVFWKFLGTIIWSRWVPETLKIWPIFFQLFWTAEISLTGFWWFYVCFEKMLSFLSWRVAIEGASKWGWLAFKLIFPSEMRSSLESSTSGASSDAASQWEVENPRIFWSKRCEPEKPSV